MKRFVVCVVVLVGCLAFSGCTLDYNECGVGGLGCSGAESVCVCSSGKCAEPDEDCASGLHYVGGRCVPEDEARSGIPSTPDRPGTCPGHDGGGDVHDTVDARDSSDVRSDGAI
jgi:hypothetical protein